VQLPLGSGQQVVVKIDQSLGHIHHPVVYTFSTPELYTDRLIIAETLTAAPCPVV
jgi:hypothetical protein